VGRAGPAGGAGLRSYVEEESSDSVTLRKKAVTAWHRGRRQWCKGCAGKIRQPDDRKIFFTRDLWYQLM
jgi:hypothetical protein